MNDQNKGKDYIELLSEGLNYNTVSYIESILSNIREQLFDYSTRLNTIDLGTGQSIRDQVSVFSAQLADVYGDVVTARGLEEARYVFELRESHIHLWYLYQNPDKEINPAGKLSKAEAKDKARYQSQIDCYHIAQRIAKLKGLEERCNGIWRYTIPKFLDSIASRITLTKDYPNGLPSTALAMSQRSKSEFGALFGDLDDSTTKATEILEEIKKEYNEDIIPDSSGFMDPNL